MMIFCSIVLGSLLVFFLGIFAVGMAEYLSDLKREQSFLKKQSDLTRKGLERANNEPKIK
jgi:hypothetical protein